VKNHLQITNKSNGLTLNVVAWKDDDGRWRIKFYDDRFKGDGFDPVLGQFVTEYYVETLMKDVERLTRTGLCLDGGVADWLVDADQMQKVIDFVNAPAD
jgi:hypothetical protein